jgi:hypothetical protein
MDADPLSHANRTFEVSREPQPYLASETGLYLVAAVLIVVFGGAANAYFLAGWYVGMGPALGVEHGAIEDTQLCVLGIALALFLLAYRKASGAVKVAAAALSMLIAAGLVREIDIRSLGGPEWLRWLSRHGLQEILFALMALPVPVYLLARRRYFAELVRLALRRDALFLYLAGVLIFLASVVLDRRVVHGEAMRFWEELIEYNGYLLFAAAAWCHAWLIGDPRYNREVDEPAAPP